MTNRPRNRLVSERGNKAWGWEGGGKTPENTDEMKGMEEDVENSLPECSWLDNLSEDPYYRGLQDKVPVVFVGVNSECRTSMSTGNKTSLRVGCW